MKIEAKVYLIAKNDSKTKALVSVTLDDCMVVSGIKVIAGNDGEFVSMPNYRKADGTYQDIAFPITKEFRQELIDTIFDAYDRKREEKPKQSNRRR